MTASRYAILGRLATGGMAELFLARATGGTQIDLAHLPPEAEVDLPGGPPPPGDYVVLKRVKPKRVVDPQFVTMFLDEARLAAQLHHDNIAKVHDIGRLGESYFFTMEYVHGEDVRLVLSRLARQKQHLPVGHALYIARGVAAGLHYAHERTGPDGQPLGIVHRDVSPSNVMVSYQGAVKLVDFGVAKAAHRTAKTQAGAVKGKVTYFSPEQCRGKPVDPRSDVFALGILFHEMLTGGRLFRRPTDYQTLMAIISDTVLPPSSRRPSVTPALDKIVMTALARDPADRYQTAGDMAAAIDAVAAADGWPMSASDLGGFMRELFGTRRLPWLELGDRDEAPSVVSVLSVIANPTARVAEGSELYDTQVEAQLKASVPLRPDAATERPLDDPTTETKIALAREDDEWRDEVVTLGEPCTFAPTVDPADAIAAVRAAAAVRAPVPPVADTFDAVDDGATVATPPPSWVIGEHRTMLAPVPERRPSWLVVLVVVAAAMIAFAMILAD